MNGKIDEKGYLHIKRGENMTAQICPFDPSAANPDFRTQECGDWCSLFSESEPHEEWVADRKRQQIDNVSASLENQDTQKIGHHKGVIDGEVRWFRR